ncbi:MAG: 1,4-dihydroxy-2-naphthoate octaprenyltransferase [Mucilaginibacter sp.]|nr:1,4-dihydroxy-2-naphthoate octaprenyltransferase [Mucilaginibacter sp.]
MYSKTERTDLFGLDINTVKLLRIPFSYFLMPIFFFALSQVKEIDWVKAIICFFVLHLFIYPASNGYNSYMDQDESSIGGLENPPKPTKTLFYTSIFFDIIGLSLSLLIGLYFCISVLAYILASRAYSYKGIRIKKYPIPGFLTVVFFQGAFTFWMVYNGVSKNVVELDNNTMLVLAACLFLISGVYPLTQVYQHEADKAAGDITISYILGIKGTFIFCSVMFAVSNVLLYFYFSSKQKTEYFILFQVFLFPVILFFIQWFLKVLKDNKQASFKNTMRMNFTASTCMNLFFITLLILNTIR